MAEAIVSKVRQFAFSFKPTFQASSLASLCNFPREKTEIAYVLKFWPFSKYKTSHKKEECKRISGETKKFEIRDQDKKIIQNELQSQFASGSINFDDKSLLNKISAILEKPTGFQPEFDEDSNEIKFEQRCSEKVDSNNNTETASFNIQEQLYQDKRAYELEKYKLAVEKNIGIQRGNQLQSRIIEKINSEGSYNFVENKQLYTEDFGFFRLCGIVDGIDEARKTLIEVKTRKFIQLDTPIISLKDKLQCLAYMKLTGCEKCLLVESGPDGKQNRFPIDWDEEEFEERIASRLRSFVIKYRNMNENEFRLKVRKYKF